jgi:hypothetical protein
MEGISPVEGAETTTRGKLAPHPPENPAPSAAASMLLRDAAFADGCWFAMRSASARNYFWPCLVLSGCEGECRRHLRPQWAYGRQGGIPGIYSFVR